MTDTRYKIETKKNKVIICDKTKKGNKLFLDKNSFDVLDFVGGWDKKQLNYIRTILRQQKN